MTITHFNSRAKQSGAVLITGLIILAVLLLLSASAVMLSNTQFKVAGNMQFQNLAMSGAESAIATAENWLNENYNATGFSTAGTPGLYPANTSIDPLTMQWNDTTSINVDAAGNSRYAIELYMVNRAPPTNSIVTCNPYGMTAPCPKVNLYRISARGISALGATKIVQSFYAVRVNN